MPDVRTQQAIESWDRPLWFDGEPWKDGRVYYGCDEGGLVVHPDAQPNDMTNEDGDILWLPKHWYPTAAKAKYAALKHDAMDGAWYPDLRCRTVWMRCQDDWEDGEIGYSSDGPGSTWWVVDAGEEHAHPFWRITEKNRA